MDRNCDAFIRSNNTYDILIARESVEISDDRAEGCPLYTSPGPRD